MTLAAETPVIQRFLAIAEQSAGRDRSNTRKVAESTFLSSVAAPTETLRIGCPYTDGVPDISYIVLY